MAFVSILNNLEIESYTGFINSYFFNQYIEPLLYTLIALAGLVSVLFIVYSGIIYMTSRGKPNQLEKAKRNLKNALLGLILVIGASVLVSLLTNSFGANEITTDTSLSSISEIKEVPNDGSLLSLIIQTLNGVLNQIIYSLFSPLMQILNDLSQATPLISSNNVVAKLWLAVLGIANSLLILIITLLGFQMMTANALGFEELNLKQLLPKIGAIFLLMNSSLLIIDILINLSNGMIETLRLTFNFDNFWNNLQPLFGQDSGLNLALLIILLIFIILAFMLTIYYIARLITLYLGAILSPLVILLSLLPSFKDFARISFKTYISHIFVLFVHSIIFILASSLLISFNNGSILISLILVIATLITVLKTQGLINQLNYASLTPKSLKKIGNYFINGTSQTIEAIREIQIKKDIVKNN